MAHVRQESTLGPVSRLSSFFGPAKLVLHLPALSYVMQDDQFALRPAAIVKQQRNAHIVMKASAGPFHSEIRYFLRPETFQQIGKPFQQACHRLADNVIRHDSNDRLSRRIEIHDPVLRIQHHHTIAHAINKRIACHRHDIEQPITPYSPEPGDTGHSESGWCQIQLRDRTHIKDIYHIPNQRDKSAD